MRIEEGVCPPVMRPDDPVVDPLHDQALCIDHFVNNVSVVYISKVMTFFKCQDLKTIYCTLGWNDF